MIRCRWAVSEIMVEYHDLEWGVPIHDDRSLFELLVLEGAQAGLSWETILKRRSSYRAAFDDFDPVAVSAYDHTKISDLLANPGIIRNRLKIEAAVNNARSLLAVREEFGSFDRYVWSFVGGRARQNRWKSPEDIPTRTPESEALSRGLRRYGFVFAGPTICYAFMQAIGMVNDHLTSCFRHREVSLLA